MLKKRLVSFILALVLLVTLLPLGMFDAQAAAVSTGEGFGLNGKFLTEIRPVEGFVGFEQYIPIGNRAELEKIGNDDNYPLTGKYYLTADIDLLGTEWTPIGSIPEGVLFTLFDKYGFSGIFDGQGYVIKNMTIRDNNPQTGLFAVLNIGGIIQNLGIENINIEIHANSTSFCGAIAGIAYTYDRLGVNVKNCYSTGSINVFSQSDDCYTGGIVGYIKDAGALYYTPVNPKTEFEFQYCYNEATINIEAEVNNQKITTGGIIGIIDSNTKYNLSVGFLYNYGKTTVKNGTTTGGIVGCTDSSIINCENSADIETGYHYTADYITGTTAGGIVGTMYNVQISNCLNKGKIIVSNGASIGGIIGNGAYSEKSPSVKKCSNFGEIVVDKRATAVGGIIGILNGWSYTYIEDCFNDGYIQIDSDAYISIGGIAGVIYTGNYGSSMYFYNAHNTGSINAVKKHTNSNNDCFLGGLIGHISTGGNNIIEQCSNNGNIDFCHNNTKTYMGGLVGNVTTYSLSVSEDYVVNASLSVRRSYNAGNISGTAYDSYYNSYSTVGGIIGNWRSEVASHLNTAYYILNCYNIGNLNAKSNPAGGFIGNADYVKERENLSVSIRNSYSAGTIASDDNATGFVGKIGPIFSITGVSSFNVENCLSLSSFVSGGVNNYLYNDTGLYSRPGSSISAYQITINNSYALSPIPEGVNNSLNGLISYENALKQESYTQGLNWDFYEIWKMPEGGGYPILQWQNEEEHSGGEPDDDLLYIKRIISPTNAILSNTPQPGGPNGWFDGIITAIVPNMTESQLINIEPSIAGSEWKLLTLQFINGRFEYAELPNKSKHLPLEIGENNALIELTAPWHDPKIYLLTLTRREYEDPRVAVYYDSDGAMAIEYFDHTLDYYIARTDSKTYSRDLGLMSAALSCAAYNTDRESGLPPDYYIKQSLLKNGFATYKSSNYYEDPNDSRYGPHSVAFTIAQKPMAGEKTLVAIILRGTSGDADWASNMSVNLTGPLLGKHRGFSMAMESAYAELIGFLGSLRTDDDTIYYLTGHSRGAAISNLLSIKLADNGVSKSNIYSYNFATPDVEVAFPSVWNWFGDHDNIMNFINRYDPVPYIPGSLGNAAILPTMNWGKFGQRFYFSSGDGFNVSGKWHDQKIYLNYMRTAYTPSSLNGVSDWAIDVWNGLLGGLFTIFCPVDVDIVDAHGNVVVSIKDNVADSLVPESGDIIILTGDDGKIVFILGDHDYKLILTGTDTGKMNFGAMDYHFVSGERFDQKSFQNIQLYRGKTMLCDIGGGTKKSDLRLFVLDDQGNPAAEVNPDGSEAPIGNPPSDATTLQSLVVSTGTLNPVFNPDTTNYTVAVPNSIESIVITATANDANATIAGTGTKALIVGANRFDIIVTAENGDKLTYTINVTRQAPPLSNDATLKTLAVSAGMLTPVFNANTTNYAVTVPNSSNKITITAGVNDKKATVTGAGTKNLDVGANRFDIIVTAENGDKRTYTIDVTREAKPLPANSDADFLRQRAAGILKNGLSQNELRLAGKVLTLVLDGREFVLSTNANNRNISGEIALGDGYYLKFDIKGNGSNIKEFSVIKK